MKASIHYKIGVLIGLLSLNSLSSCLHTRQELGISWGGVKRSYRLNPWPWRIGGTVTTVAASAAGVFGGMEAWRAFGSSGNGNPIINGTDVTAEINATDVTDVTTISSLAPTGEPTKSTTVGENVTSELEARFKRSLEKAKEEGWG